MKQKRKRGAALIAVLAVFAALAIAPAAGAASVGRVALIGHFFGLDASWAEGA